MKTKLFPTPSSSTSSSTSSSLNPSTSSSTSTSLNLPSNISSEDVNMLSINPLSDINTSEYNINTSLPNDISSIIDFISTNNISASGNITLLSTSDLKKLQKLNLSSIILTLKSSNINNENAVNNENNENTVIIGLVLSISLPISVNGTEQKSFGYTTFLNINKNYRNKQITSVLIKNLIDVNYAKNIFHGYQITSFPLNKNSLKINIYYRPINLKNSLLAGFIYPGFNNISEFNKHRIFYKSKSPDKFLIKQIKPSNLNLVHQCYTFYSHSIKNKDTQNKDTNQNNKKFTFSPDENFFRNWITLYDSYIVQNAKHEIVGIFSVGSLSCKTLLGNSINLAIPYLFSSTDSVTTLKCFLYIAEQKDYDVFYCHSIGDLSDTVLKTVSCIQADRSCYFSLYNSDIQLSPSDLYIPLF